MNLPICLIKGQYTKVNYSIYQPPILKIEPFTTAFTNEILKNKLAK